jgi:hypothetical protein
MQKITGNETVLGMPSWQGENRIFEPAEGMPLRLYIATMIQSGLVSNPTCNKFGPNWYSETALKHVDVLIDAYNKTPNPNDGSQDY